MRIKHAIALLFVALAVTGCESCRMIGSHLQSGAVALDRRITVLTITGDTLRVWTTRTMIEYDSAGPAHFFDERGKRVSVYNATVISEEQ